MPRQRLPQSSARGALVAYAHRGVTHAPPSTGACSSLLAFPATLLADPGSSPRGKQSPVLKPCTRSLLTAPPPKLAFIRHFPVFKLTVRSPPVSIPNCDTTIMIVSSRRIKPSSQKLFSTTLWQIDTQPAPTAFCRASNHFFDSLQWSYSNVPTPSCLSLRDLQDPLIKKSI